jgi:alpha-L-fucosidase 2
MPLLIRLLPALPKKWPSGEIKSAQIRGGISVDLKWIGGKPRSVALHTHKNARPRVIQVIYEDRVVTSFNSSRGITVAVQNIF